MRTSNKLERLNQEIKRRFKAIGRHPDESGAMSLIYGVTKKYAANQKGSLIGDLERALWKRLREEKISMLKQLELDVAA